MKRGYVIGLGVAAGVAGAAVLGREQLAAMASRAAGRDDAPIEKQWAFDSGELRTLMDRVVAEQQSIVAAAETPVERERAAAFQKYYEGRRAAAH
ncbi:MAG TPA: hypothetical protein VIL85_27855 [Thermomicrobiales bacterium]